MEGGGGKRKRERGRRGRYHYSQIYLLSSLVHYSLAFVVNILGALSIDEHLQTQGKVQLQVQMACLELRCIPTAFTRSPSIPFLLHGGDHMRMKLAVHIPAMLWCHASAQTNEWLSSHPYRQEKDLWRRDRDTNGECGLYSPQPYISLSDVHHKLM